MDSALSEYKDLSDEELVLSAKNDRKAVSELIVRYLRTVHFLASRYSGDIYEDLVQEGFVGLLKAVNTYRPDENVKMPLWSCTSEIESIRSCASERRSSDLVSINSP